MDVAIVYETLQLWFTELLAAGLGNVAEMIHVFTAAGFGNQFPYKNNTFEKRNLT